MVGHLGKPPEIAADKRVFGIHSDLRLALMTGEKDVHKLTQALIKESLLFRMLKVANYPRLVAFGHSIVAVCLREEGILQ